MKVSDRTMDALALALNMRQMRQEVLASNIANDQTPGYKSKRLDFEEALSQALDLNRDRSMQVADSRHFNVGGGGLDSVKPEIYDDPNGIVSEDGNTVDRDAEMAKLAENKIMYDAAVQMLNKKLALMKYAVGQDN